MSNRVNRRYFFTLQRGQCIYCGTACLLDGCPHAEKLFTIDHIVPLALNGRGDRANLAGACRLCNQERSVATSFKSKRGLRLKFLLERDILNRHRQVEPISDVPTQPMALGDLDGRPWADSEVLQREAALVIQGHRCLECLIALPITWVGVRSYCCPQCRSRAKRRRYRDNRAAGTVSMGTGVHIVMSAESIAGSASNTTSSCGDGSRQRIGIPAQQL